MSKEKKFAIGISNGMKIDLETGYEDMPEGVRAYLEEVARQLEEEGEDGGEEEAVRRMAFYLRGAFRLLFANSEEWNGLGVVTAAQLYDDVSAVMLHLAADFHRLADAAGKVPMEPEEDDEEEADSDDSDAE